MRKNILAASIDRALSLGAKTAALSTGVAVLSFGVKTIALSVGATAISLGINLTQLDDNVAVAALSNVGCPHAATGVSGAATLDACIGVTGAGAAASATAIAGAFVGYAGGIVYASELFSATTVVPSTGLAAVVYQIESNLVGKFDVSFTLDNGAVFDKVTAYLDKDDAAVTDATALPAASTGTGTGYNVATFRLDASAGSLTTADTDNIYLTYTLKNVAALATPGQKVQMSVAVKDILSTYAVGVASSGPIVVAESKQGVGVEILSYTDTAGADDRVSVSSGNLEFLLAETASKAQIGSINITNKTSGSADSTTAIHGPDGVKAWLLGDTTAGTGGAAVVGSITGTGTSATKTTLSITNGQFAASKADGSGVMLGTATFKATDDTTAVIKLGDSELKALAAAGADLIYIIADGKTAINVPEEPPVAELHIEYTDTTAQKITYPAVELKRIKQDGTKCMVYNVPASGSADTLGVRITNDSAKSDMVYATMYDGTGAVIYTQQALNKGEALGKGATLFVNTADLEALGKWTGRGVLELTTKLSSIEVLGLLRDNATGILSNLSTGATGDGCTN